MAIKIGINGFGRIGRAVVRAVFEQGLEHDIQIVHINSRNKRDDFAETSAHLLVYDTLHGRFNAKVSALDGGIKINNQSIRLSSFDDPIACPWQEAGVDIVFECTGKYRSHDLAMRHIQAGAKKVLISAPGGEGVNATVVYGVNHQIIKKSDLIVSNASCTTNCLAPLILPLYRRFGLESGIMTTIHAYTSDQMLLDNNHKDLRRARAAALSMIPAETGAAKAIGLVIPELEGKLVGGAVRVPVANVSMVDLTFTVAKKTSVSEVNACLTEAASSFLAGVLEVNDLPLVSVDFNHNQASSIADLSQTRVVGSTVKVMSWYDNEWGFACRMLDVAKYMAQLDEK